MPNESDVMLIETIHIAESFLPYTLIYLLTTAIKITMKLTQNSHFHSNNLIKTHQLTVCICRQILVGLFPDLLHFSEPFWKWSVLQWFLVDVLYEVSFSQVLKRIKVYFITFTWNVSFRLMFNNHNIKILFALINRIYAVLKSEGKQNSLYETFCLQCVFGLHFFKLNAIFKK